jgi:hypothetical protein
MPKMSVYVPDDLYAEAQAQLKVGNWSELFQKALKDQLQPSGERREIQRDLDEVIDVEALRSRMRSERLDIYRRGYAVGLKRGAEMDYPTLLYCKRMDWQRDKLRDVIGDLDDSHVLDDELKDVWERNKHLARWPYDTPNAYGSIIEMEQGFAGGLRRIWELAMEDASDESARTEPGATGNIESHMQIVKEEQA